MTPARVEVVLLHLGVNLIEVPVVVIKSVHSAHDTSAMTATCTMNIEPAGGRIVHELEKLFNLSRQWVGTITHWNVDVVHSECFHRWSFIRLWILSQIDHCVDTKVC